MRRKNRVSQLVAAAIVTLCSSPTMLAQQPDVVFDPRDFSGDWDRITSIAVFSNVPGATAYGNSVIAVGDPDLTADASTQEAPFTAEGKVRYDANMPGYGPRSEFRRNDPLGRCEPMGLVRNLNVEIIPPHLTFEIVQTPGRIFQFFEYRHDWREIWMDGRALPNLDDVFLKWNGHSVGHMEGDTLVVESVGFDDPAARSPGHGDAITAGPVRVAGVEIGFAGTTGCQHHEPGLEQLYPAGLVVEHIGALAAAFTVDQVDGHPIGEYIDVVAGHGVFHQHFGDRFAGCIGGVDDPAVAVSTLHGEVIAPCFPAIKFNAQARQPFHYPAAVADHEFDDFRFAEPAPRGNSVCHV